MLGSYSLVFTLDSIHQITQKFIIQQNIFVFTMTFCCNNIFIHTLYFFILLSPPKNEYTFGFNLTNSSIATPPISSFNLPTTNLFKSS